MKTGVLKLLLVILAAFPIVEGNDVGMFKFGYSCFCLKNEKKPSSVVLKIKGVKADGSGVVTLKSTPNGYSGEWIEEELLNLTTGKQLKFTIKVRGTYSAMVETTNPATRYELARTYEFKLEDMLNQLQSPCPGTLDEDPACAGKEGMFRLKKTKELGPTKRTFGFGVTCICAPDEATDPYAVVYLLDKDGKQVGKAILKTETEDNTVTGVWKKKLNFLYDAAKNQSFKIEVWDDDGDTVLNRNDKLGTVIVRIDKIVKDKYTVNTLVAEKGQLDKCPKSYTFSPNTYIGICEDKLMPLVSVADRTSASS